MLAAMSGKTTGRYRKTLSNTFFLLLLADINKIKHMGSYFNIRTLSEQIPLAIINNK
jgi:hypothetical protein